MKEFKPWEEFENIEPTKIDVEGPPCSRCMSWRPVAKFISSKSGVKFDGVRLCHAGEMQSDFSCYAALEEDER